MKSVFINGLIMSLLLLSGQSFAGAATPSEQKEELANIVHEITTYMSLDAKNRCRWGCKKNLKKFSKRFVRIVKGKNLDPYNPEVYQQEVSLLFLETLKRAQDLNLKSSDVETQTYLRDISNLNRVVSLLNKSLLKREQSKKWKRVAMTVTTTGVVIVGGMAGGFIAMGLLSPFAFGMGNTAVLLAYMGTGVTVLGLGANYSIKEINLSKLPAEQIEYITKTDGAISSTIDDLHEDLNNDLDD